MTEECDRRQRRLTHYEKKLDEWNRAMRDLAQDLEVLRRTKENLLAKNESMQRQLNELQSVDEVHIEFDVLSTSESGMLQLKEKMGKILARIDMEERRYKELQAEYLALKKYVEVAHKIKTQLEEARKAGEIEELHFQRAQDLMYIARTSKQTVLCQEAIIANLSKATRYVVSHSHTNCTFYRTTS